MKSVILAVMLFASSIALSQPVGVAFQRVDAAPSGICQKGDVPKWVVSTGDIWACRNIVGTQGTWTTAVSGVSLVPIAAGGTNAATAATALSNLGGLPLAGGTMATNAHLNFAGTSQPGEPAQIYLYEHAFDQGTLDPIMTRGFNNNVGGRANPALNAIWESVEFNYETNTQEPDGLEHYFQEWYIQTVDALGNAIRPFFFTADNQNINNLLLLQMKISPTGSLTVSDTDGSLSPLIVNGNGDVGIFNKATALYYGARPGSSLNFVDGTPGGVIQNSANTSALEGWDDNPANPHIFFRPIKVVGATTWQGTGGDGSMTPGTNRIDFKTTGTALIAIQSAAGAYFDAGAGGQPLDVGTQQAGQQIQIGTPTASITTVGTIHYAGTTPTASVGTIETHSTNQGGSIGSLSAATTTTITFANSGWTNVAYCTASTSQASTTVQISAISKTAVTFTFPSLTGTLYYQCNGN